MFPDINTRTLVFNNAMNQKSYSYSQLLIKSVHASTSKDKLYVTEP